MYNPYQYNYGQYFNQPISPQPVANNQPTVQQLQDGGFVAVQSKEEAQNYLVANGTSVTFIDRAAKKLYVKINSFSPLDAPIFESYSLVKDEDSAPTPAPARSTDEDIKELKSEVEKLKAEVGKLSERGVNDE